MISKNYLKEQAYTHIRKGILQGKIRVDRIYSAQCLANSLQITRTPVREALLQLASENMVDFLPNRGVIIKPMTAEEAKNIYQMRAALEGGSCAYYAENIHGSNVKNIAQHLREQLDRFSWETDTSMKKSIDMSFHDAIIEHCDNALYKESYRMIYARLQLFIMPSPAGRDGREEVIQGEHLAILNAILNKDAPGAFYACKRHMDSSCKALLGANSFQNDSLLYEVENTPPDLLEA